MKETIDAYVQSIVRKAGKDGIELSIVGNKVYEKYKIKPRDYGYAQFNKYIKSLEHIVVEQNGAKLIARYKK